MTPLISIILLVGSLRTGLPLEDPLNWWLYLFGSGSSEMFPGTLPSADTEDILTGMVTRTEFRNIADFILEKSSGADRMNDESSMHFTLEGTVAGELVYRSDDFESRCGATGRIFADITPNLFVDERLSLWAGSDENPPDYFTPFHQGLEPGRHLYVDWGYLRWTPGPLSISFGRIPQKWGPGRFAQLLLSDNSPPLDMLKLELDLWDIVKFSGLTSSVNSDSGIYLTAHRLDIEPLQNLRIGLSESILFKAEGLDLAYVNPVIPWYPVQWNERVDDNAFFCFDASWKPLSGLETYGELLIDDIQYENTGNRPNKLGWTTGVSALFPGTRAGIVIEYTRIDRYVYSQREPCNYYLHDGRIIGSGLGPDADRITASTGISALWPLSAEATVSHTRHGEGTVQEGWPDSASTGGIFPSGIVEYTTDARLHLGWYPLNSVELHTTIGKTWIRNMGHVTGETGSEIEAALELIWTW